MRAPPSKRVQRSTVAARAHTHLAVPQVVEDVVDVGGAGHDVLRIVLVNVDMVGAAGALLLLLRKQLLLVVVLLRRRRRR